MRLAAFVSPNSRPTIQATRSNPAMATRPQLRPPTMRSVAASRSSFFIAVHLLYRYCPEEGSEHIPRCQVTVQMLYSHQHGSGTPPDRRAQQADGREPRASPRLGAPLRPPEADALHRRAAPVLVRRPRARDADAAAPRRWAG